jgi:hypothetical protein
MRIPFPVRIPFHGAAIFAVVLFAVERVEGTPLYFCTGAALFLLVATLAFNTAGGLTRASGAYIFFFAVLDVVIGLVYKAFLGEPADANLSDPHTTIEVYVAGTAAMFLAAFLSRRFSRKEPLLGRVMKEDQMYPAAVGCIVAGIVLAPILGLLGQSGLRIQTAFNQLNYLIPLGVILGVLYEIRRSGGRRSVNLMTVGAMIYCFVMYGLIGFSKQGMLVGPVCWVIAAWSQRYRFSRVQVAGVLMGAILFFRYLTPIAQTGKNIPEAAGTLPERAELALRMLEDPEKTRDEYLAVNADARGLNSYYNTPQGFWDRLQFISVDDALINVTDQGKVFGLLPLEQELLNAIPHVFWPDKPTFNYGNVYAHEIGNFTEDDTTTGISFGPMSEAYHMAKWTGVLVVAPLLWFVLFTLFDSLFGDIRLTPWGLLATVMISHIAPEGAMTGVVHLITYGPVILGFCAVFAAWVAPLMAIGVAGAGRGRKIAGAAA